MLESWWDSARGKLTVLLILFPLSQTWDYKMHHVKHRLNTGGKKKKKKKTLLLRYVN